jgi:hypothetical protein
MVDILCNYILLEYSPTVRSEAAIPCLVIAHFFTQQADLDGDHSLKVIAPEKWSEEISCEHREYLDALIKDWKETPHSEIRMLLEQLSHLSIGPLRTVHVAHCSPTDLGEIAAKFLGYRPPVNFGASVDHSYE